MLRQRLLVVVLGIALLAWFCRMAPLTGWDEAFYLAQLVSLASDHDLFLHDDLLALENAPDVVLRSLLLVRGDGALRNDFPIGPALARSAYTWPVLLADDRFQRCRFRYVLAIGSILTLLLLALVTRRVVMRVAPSPRKPLADEASLAAVLSIALGPLAVYGTREYLGSHLLSAFWCATFLLALLRWSRSYRRTDAALLGLTAGLLAVTRWQDAAIVAAFLPALVASLPGCRQDIPRRRVFDHVAIIGATALLPVLAQALAWKRQLGSYLLIPQGSAFLHWHRPEISAFVFSPFHGLLPWAPGFALGLAAAVWLSLRPSRDGLPRFVGAGIIASVVLSVYLSAAAEDWWAGASYGPRRLSSLAPIAAIGLAHVLSRLTMARRALLVLPLLGWTWFTATAYYSRFDDLALLLRGTPHSSNPMPPDPRAPAVWVDDPGRIPVLLRPAFTFADAPDDLDRIVGAAVVAAAVAIMLLAWRRLRTSARLQTVAVGAAVAWTGVAAAWIASAPANGQWNRAWLAVVTGRAEPAAASTLPADALVAARIVRAAHARAGGMEQGREDVPFPVDRGLSDLNRRLLHQLRTGGPGALDERPPP